MPTLFFVPPEYAEWRTESQIKEQYEIDFKGSGWYELKNDDVLLIIERHSRLKIFLWIGIDPREEIEKLLDLPTFNND